MNRPHTDDPTGRSRPSPVARATPERVVGRTLTDVSCHIGSYGMGGVGWMGWELDGQEWLVLSIHASVSWMRLRWNGVDRIINAHPDQIDWAACGVHHQHPQPAKKLYPVWRANWGGSPKIDNFPDFKKEGCVITSFDLDRTVFRLGLTLDDDEFYLTEASDLPLFGNGEVRCLNEFDDLRVALNIFNTRYIDV